MGLEEEKLWSTWRREDVGETDGEMMKQILSTKKYNPLSGVDQHMHKAQD